ncbi:tRNA(fMet)-specific endonuclease VapC [compost metagenome]
MAKKVLIDTGYWIALFNERDAHHADARLLDDDLKVHTLLVPWPTLFECVNTRLARRRDVAARFRQFLSRPTTVLVNDAQYRDKSLEFTLGEQHHTYSLTDHILRSMIEDVDLAVDAFLSFNPADFYDVCAKRGVTMFYD